MQNHGTYPLIEVLLALIESPVLFCMLLCRKDMHGLARNGTIVMAIANHKFLDFVLNWVHYVRKVQMDHYIVGTLDGELLPLLAKNKVHCVSLSEGKCIAAVLWLWVDWMLLKSYRSRF
jgi:hypothetical protein